MGSKCQVQHPDVILPFLQKVARDDALWLSQVNRVREMCIWQIHLFNGGQGGCLGFPCGSAVKESPCNAGAAGNVGSIPGLGRSPDGGHDNPLQYSCLESLMVRGAWLASPQGRKESNMTEATEQAGVLWGGGHCLYNCYKMLYNSLIGLQYSEA